MESERLGIELVRALDEGDLTSSQLLQMIQQYVRDNQRGDGSTSIKIEIPFGWLNQTFPKEESNGS